MSEGGKALACFRALKDRCARFLSARNVLFLAVVFSAAVLSAQTALPPAAVWVADHKNLKQLDPATNQFIRTLGLAHEAEALAVDPKDGALWALSEKHLLKFNAAGAALLDIDLKPLAPKLPNPKRLVLDPYDGSIWVGGKRGIGHLSASGQKLSEASTADEIEAVALDVDQSLWVLTKKELKRLSAQGSFTASLALRPYINDPKHLAVDGLGALAWIAAEKDLLQFDLANLGKPPLAVPLPGTSGDPKPKIEALALEPLAGTLWIAAKDRLFGLDRSAHYLTTTDLAPQNLGEIEAAAIEPVSESLWLGGKKALGRLSASGGFVAKLPADKEIAAIGVGAFSLYPTLSLLEPADGGYTNNPRPTMRLGLGASCSGSPCSLVDAYLRSFSLSADLNGSAVGPLFSIANGEARYSPANRLPEGLNTLKATAKDLFGHSSEPLTGRFTVDTVAPQFVALSPADGAALTAPPVTIQGRVNDPTASVTLQNASGAVLNLGGANFSFAVTLQPGLNSFTLTARDPAGNVASAPLRLALSNVPPAPVPSPLNPTRFTPFAEATAFLYSGGNPVQTGVNSALLDPNRVAVLRGRVLARDGGALPGVKITVLGRPESGQTLSRADGEYDLVANGGGIVTLRFEKPGYMSAQRDIRARWLNYALLPDVVLLPYDTQVTTVDLSAPIPIQVARGSRVSDSDGTRQATIFFPQGTTSTLIKPDGSTQALTRLSVRATEYTVGPEGPKAMPAPLPPTSGYTYAVELSADEAIAAGAKTVRFSWPVVLYVENFLNFPVGGLVPVGFYDFDRAAWIPSDNGRVVKILSIAGGLAALDTDGDGVADSPAQLAALGISTAEQAQLTSLYAAGQSLWRVPTTHFTPCDPNWPLGPPPDAIPPPPPGPDDSDAGPGPGGGDGDISGGSDGPGPGGDGGPGGPGPDRKCGSVIECQNQVLGESVKLTGTPFNLIYRSNHVIGSKKANTLTIPISTTTVPASLKRIELEISVGGRYFTQSFAPISNQTITYRWDGKDVYGRDLQGMQPALIRIGYVYDAVYTVPARWGQSFGGAPGVPLAIPSRFETTLTREATKQVSPRDTAPDARVLGIGGWSLDEHHTYDPQARILYMGNGSRRGAYNLGAIIASVARVDNPNGVAVDAVGNIFYVDYPGHRVVKLGTDGISTTVAGNGTRGYNGDGGPAISAALNYPEDITVDRWGNLFIADTGNHRTRRISPDGTITTVAGNGIGTFGGDNGLATSASLFYPSGVAVDAEGSLYIADTFNHRIRRVNPAGFINTVAGNGTKAFGGDGGPAAQAALDTPNDVAVDDQGNLFIADSANSRIRKVTAAGIISTFAGNGGGGPIVDGVPAISARLGYPISVAVDPQSNLFIGDGGRVRRVSPTGKIVTTAGPGAGEGPNGEGGLATLATIFGVSGLAVDPQGNLLITDFGGSRVRKVGPAFPGNSQYNITVSSEDGSELYEFDPAGRHMRTLNARTGATRYSFIYNANGYLIQVRDGNGNTTTIERGPGDALAAIVSPDGQRTTLTLDGNGYLASIANPAGETTRMAYTPDGLMTLFTNPRGFTSTMAYDVLGRLTREDNAAGGFWALARTVTDRADDVSLTSTLGRRTLYRVENVATGGQNRINTYPDGSREVRTLTTSGRSETLAPDGTRTVSQQGGDPRFGMMSPVTEFRSVETPSGVSSATYTTRTVNLADPNNLFVITDEIWRNGELYARTYDAASRQSTLTSPLGRQYVSATDAQGRVIQRRIAGLEATTYNYDTRGRLIGIAQGSGAEQRSLAFAYNSAGYVQQATDSLGRTQTLSYDAAGRLTQHTLPDGRVIRYSYDTNGNVTSVTPPSRPVHGFAYTPVDLEERYTPPTVAGIAAPATQYSYNADKQLTQITRPDGQNVTLSYDSGGRRSTISYPGGSTTRGYHPANGKLATIATGDGQSLAYTYDGFLPTEERWTGAVNGTVARGYNNDFRIASLSVNGAAIPFTYDSDGLLTQAGTLSLTRHAQNGLITGSTLGSVTTNQGYNGFGEIASLAAASGGNSLCSAQYSRDNLGRITEKTETVQGQTGGFT